LLNLSRVELLVRREQTYESCRPVQVTPIARFGAAESYAQRAGIVKKDFLQAIRILKAVKGGQINKSEGFAEYLSDSAFPPDVFLPMLVEYKDLG